METLLYLLLSLPAIISALTIHEFAHAWTAYKLGDDTAERQGRLTLDPLVHLDPFGSLLFLVAVFTGAPLIGSAKPVPFNMRNLSHPRRDAILIAIAGPISNILQAIVWLASLFIFRIAAEKSGVVFDTDAIFNIIERSPDLNSIPSVVATILTAGVLTNITLAVFNMIPIPPLDGHYVLEGLGPPWIADLYNQIRPISIYILMGLLYFRILQIVMAPFIIVAYRLVLSAFGSQYSF